MSEPDEPKQPSSAPPTSTPEPPADTQPFVATIQSVWAQIRHHKVVQWTLAYLAIAYTLLHGAEMLVNSLGWSHGLLRLFTLLLFLGVPVVITLSWYHGARGQRGVSGTELMIIAILLALGGTFLWRDSRTEHRDERAATVVPAQPVSAPAAPAIPEKSIAVLPFANMSSDKEQEYFSDGLSEELLDLLTKIPQLQVAARTSSFYYKGKEVKLEEMARELHVAHILEGSVRKSGNRVRITAQLIRAADGYHQWSETYDRTLKDIFAVQDEISAAVVEHLKIVLLGEKRQAQRVDARAYDLFLQARQQARLHTAEGYQQATTLYQQGLKIDDTYPPAWSGLAYVYRRQANNGMLPLEEGYALAAEALKKTLAINPDFAPVQAELGRIALDHDGDLAAAAKYLEQALSLEPANSDILGYSAIFADSLGRLDQGVAINQYALQRDPVNPTLHNALGLEYRNNGQLDRAIDSFRTVLSLSPEDIGAHYHIGEALLLKGEFEAALAEIQKEPFEAWRMIGLPMAYHSLKRKRESDEALAALIAKYSETWPYNIAYVLAWRGEKDRAFEFLEKARVVHDPGLSDLAMEILFANIRGNARWNPFLRKLGKTPEQLAAIKFEVKLPR